jgi:hypothetical protein
VAVPAVFVLAAIGPALIGLQTLLSVNLLTSYLPWRASSGWDAPGHQICSSDTVDAGMPGIGYVRHALYAGHLPNWQNLVAGGGPSGSVPTLGLLNPLSLPYFVLPLWLAPAYVKLLEFIVAIGGMYLFLRRLDRSRLAASIGGVIFASSGFMVMWTNWPQTRVAALIPALFWALERLIQRRRVSDVGLIGLIVACMLLGGFPAVTGFALYAAAPYVLVRLICVYGRQLRRVLVVLGLGALGVVLGGALAAVQLLPFHSQLSDIDMGYRVQTSDQHLPFSGLLTLVDPSANGLCIGGVTRGSVNPIELIAYVGAGAIGLAVLAVSTFFWRRSRSDGRGSEGFLISAAIILIAVGWIGGPMLATLQQLPIFSNNFVGRIRAVLGFVLAAIAAYGFDVVRYDFNTAGHQWSRVSGRERQGKRSATAGEGIRLGRRALAVIWFASTWIAVAVIAIAILFQSHSEATHAGLPHEYWGAVRATLPIPALLLVATIFLFVLTRLRNAGAGRNTTYRRWSSSRFLPRCAAWR